MDRSIVIDGREMRMRATALIPRLYRHKFGRDMVADMAQLRRAYKKAAALPEDATEEERQEAQLSAIDLEIFENVAWLFLRHAGEDVGESPEDWLDALDGIFSVYDVMPAVLDLWSANNAQTSSPAKK